MNGHDPENPELQWNILENRQRYIIVLLAQMIEHRLTATNHSKESATRKGCERPVPMKPGAVSSKRPSDALL